MHTIPRSRKQVFISHCSDVSGLSSCTPRAERYHHKVIMEAPKNGPKNGPKNNPYYSEGPPYWCKNAKN